MIDFSYNYTGNDEKKYLTRRDLIYADQNESCLAKIETVFDFSKVDPALSLHQAIHHFLLDCLNHYKKIYIPYSGGIDSEILLQVALNTNIPVCPIIVDLFGMNSYDLYYAKKFIDIHNIKNVKFIEISKKEFFNTYLSKMLYETESTAYLLAGQYLATLFAPDDGVVVLPSAPPYEYIQFDKNSLCLEHYEWALWTHKISKLRELPVFNIYDNAQVLSSFMMYPAIIERLKSANPYSKWSVNLESLSKDVFYNDESFKKLSRRFSQHGWESAKGGHGYKKEMLPFFSENNRSFIKSSKALINTALCAEELYTSYRNGKDSVTFSETIFNVDKRVSFNNYTASFQTFFACFYSAINFDIWKHSEQPKVTTDPSKDTVTLTFKDRNISYDL